MRRSEHLKSPYFKWAMILGTIAFLASPFAYAWWPFALLALATGIGIYGALLCADSKDHLLFGLGFLFGSLVVAFAMLVLTAIGSFGRQDDMGFF